MRDLGFYVMWRGIKFFIDMMAVASHDHAFTAASVRQALLEFQKSTSSPVTTSRKSWCSRMGLKTKETMFIFFQLAQEMRMNFNVHYFAPYHGHGEVDIWRCAQTRGERRAFQKQ